MVKFAALALAGSLGLAGLGMSSVAAAGPVISVGVGVPGVAVVAYPGAVRAPAYYYGVAPYYYPYVGFGLGYGFYGPGFRGGYAYRGGYGFRGGYGYRGGYGFHAGYGYRVGAGFHGGRR